MLNPKFDRIYVDEGESRSHRQAGKFPALGEAMRLAFVFAQSYEFRAMNREKEISVFVDESGSFVPLNEDPIAPYYLLCMVFHDQDVDVSGEIAELEGSFQEMGFARDLCVHAGPLIRREQEYAQMTREERRGIFQRMLVFFRRANISYTCFKINKRNNSRDGAIHDSLLRQIVEFLISHSSEFDSYDKLKVYYDNGQSQVKELLKEAFAIYSSKTEFVPSVSPSRYRLFQAADIACTIELVRLKLSDSGKISESENAFFGGVKAFRKGYLKPLERKRHV